MIKYVYSKKSANKKKLFSILNVPTLVFFFLVYLSDYINLRRILKLYYIYMLLQSYSRGIILDIMIRN